MRSPFVHVLSSVGMLLVATAIFGPLAACAHSGGGNSSQDSGARAIELAADPATPEAREAVLRARWTVPEGLAPWTVESREHTLVERELDDGTCVRVLELRGGKASLFIPGPIAAGEFDQIEVELTTQNACTLRAFLLRGKQTLRSRPFELGGGQGARVATIPVLDAMRKGLPFDGLRIDLSWREGVPALHSPWRSMVELTWVALMDRPLERWFDLGVSQPDLVAIAGDRRLGMSLTGERPLLAHFEKRGAQRLQFSVAPVADACSTGVRPEVVVRLQGAGTSLPERVTALDPAVDPLHAWLPIAIDLAELPDGPIEARFELRGGGLAVVAEPRVVTGRVAPTTVLLITSDTHRGDHVGVSGSDIDVETPTLDALAARGLYFPRAQSTVNITIPSHAALMTGTHPRDTQLVTNRAGLASEAPTLAEVFRAAGWRTWAALSARHLLEPGDLGQGFERASAPSRPQQDGALTIEVLEKWLADGGDEPLFVWLHLFDPHTPYEPPPHFLERQLAVVDAGDSAPAGRHSEIELERGKARYRAEIDYTDSLIARVLANPRLAGAIVALTGDHGESLGEHGIRFRHQELYPDTLRVPLLLAWPGSPRGVRIENRLDHLGVAKTLLELAGLESAGFPGQSLLTWLGDGSSALEEPVFALADAGFSASITLGSWHLILYLVAHTIEADHAVEEQEVELYDLSRDPACKHNLVERQFETAKRLRAVLVQWLTSGRPGGWMHEVVLDDATRAQLAEIGYGAEDVVSGARWLELDSDAPWALRFR